jgi:hypothetical protein
MSEAAPRTTRVGQRTRASAAHCASGDNGECALEEDDGDQEEADDHVESDEHDVHEVALAAMNESLSPKSARRSLWPTMA